MRDLAWLHATAPNAPATTGPGNDGALTYFVLIAVAAFVIVAARWLGGGEGLGTSLATVGSVLTAVIVVTAIALVLFAVLLVLGMATGIGL